MAEATLEPTLYAALLPLSDDLLLLPNLALAEVVARETMRSEAEPPRPWWIGRLSWNGRLVPIIAFEALCGRPAPALGRRTRLAVINTIGTRLAAGAYALMCQGFPQLLPVARHALRAQPLTAEDSSDFVLTRAGIGNRLLAIPNLERIEAEIAEADAAAID